MIPLGVLASGYVAPAGGGLTYLGHMSSTTDSATHTFNVNIGPAATDRTVIVGYTGFASGGKNLTTFTIAGSSATVDAYANGWAPSGIGRLVVPTGNAATIVLSFNGVVEAMTIFVWTYNGTVTRTGYAALGGSSTTALSLTTGASDIVLCTAGYPDGTPSGFSMMDVVESLSVEADSFWALSTTDTGTLSIIQTPSSVGNRWIAAAAYSLT